LIQVFLQSLLIGYSGAVMPGSLLAYTIDKSFKRGAKTGILVSVGHSLLELLVVVFLLLGAAKYLGSHIVSTIIGILGGIILLYLGTSMIRESFKIKSPVDMETNAPDRHGNLIIGGIVLSASNPYFIIWWAVIGLGLVTSAFTAYGLPGVVTFYFGHILADITWYSFVSIILSKTKKFISTKVYRIIIFVLGLFLVTFGVRFVVYALKNI
jgi:threonine/homoserine/homoserine lactone efflux protein